MRTQENCKEAAFCFMCNFLQLLWKWLSPPSPGHKWQLTNAHALSDEGSETTTEQAPRWAGKGRGESIPDGHFIRFYSRNLFFIILAKPPNLTSILRVKDPIYLSPTPRARQTPSSTAILGVGKTLRSRVLISQRGTYVALVWTLVEKQ